MSSLGRVNVMILMSFDGASPCCVTQIFSPSASGKVDSNGMPQEREVAAVHYSADKMDPHGR